MDDKSVLMTKKHVHSVYIDGLLIRVPVVQLLPTWVRKLPQCTLPSENSPVCLFPSLQEPSFWFSHQENVSRASGRDLLSELELEPGHRESQ